MPVSHKKQSSFQDTANSALIQPSDWNDAHNAPPVTVSICNNIVWTNMPLAESYLGGNAASIFGADLTHADQYRLCGYVSTQGVADAKLHVEYSTNGTTWNDLDTAGMTISLFGVGWKNTGWLTIVPGGRADVLLRVRGAGGNGTADPRFSLLFAYR